MLLWPISYIKEQGGKLPLDMPERKIERRESERDRKTVMTETQRNMIERETERERVKGRR